MQNASPPRPAPGTDPGKAYPSLPRSLNAGDLDAAAACFARDGCLITPDATAIHGRDGIRRVLAQMIVRRTEIAVEMSTAVGGGEVVLIHQRWRIRSGEQEGERFEQIADATLILRRVEGTWKLSIAAPWGYRQACG